MRIKAITFIAAGLLASLPAAAQDAAGTHPRVANGRLTAQAAGPNLDAAFRRLVSAQSEPAWIGYSVPAVAMTTRENSFRGDTWISDGVVFTNGRLATCGLEPSTSPRRPEAGAAQMQNPVRLEGPDTVMILYRVE